MPRWHQKKPETCRCTRPPRCDLNGPPSPPCSLHLLRDEHKAISAITACKVQRGTGHSHERRTSSDNEDSFEYLSSEHEDNPTDLTYEQHRNQRVRDDSNLAVRALGGGRKIADDVAATAVTTAGGILNNLMNGAKWLWDISARDPVPPPTPRPKSPMRYETASGAFSAARRGQNPGVVRSPTDPRPIGIVRPCGGTRTRDTITGTLYREERGNTNSEDDIIPVTSAQYRRRRARPRSLGSLIEISDENSIYQDYIEARDNDYLEVKLQSTGQIKLQALTSSAKDKQSQKAPETDSESDKYSEPEGIDSDFDINGGVDWPLSKSAKKAHMVKIRAKRAAEPKRRRRGVEITIMARESILKLREEAGRYRESGEWPDADTAVALGAPSQEEYTSGEEAVASASADEKYFPRMQHTHEKGQELRRGSKDEKTRP